MAREEQGKEHITEEIQCSPEVTHGKINEYCEYCPQECNNCKRVMEKARWFVTNAEKSRRKNFQITCHGDHITLCFSSGSRGNQYEVWMGSDEKAHVKTIQEEASRCKSMSDCCKSMSDCCKSMSDCLKYIIVCCWNGILRIYDCCKFCITRTYDCCKFCITRIYDCCKFCITRIYDCCKFCITRIYDCCKFCITRIFDCCKCCWNGILRNLGMPKDEGEDDPLLGKDE